MFHESASRMRSRLRRLDGSHILDEQEQEEVIGTLERENRAADKSFRLVVSGLCMVPTVAFAALVNSKNLLCHLLALSSLVMTAFTLLYLPDEALDALDGPLATYMPTLNAALAGVVVVLGHVRLQGSPGFLASASQLTILPLIMVTLSAIIRWSSASTARSIRSLEKKRYRLKGA